MTEWQDISTAPRDGTSILVYGKTEKTFAGEPYMGVRFCNDCGSWLEPNVGGRDCEDWLDGSVPYGELTHWMPLPEPPK